MKTACVYHDIDQDGYMSAAIAKHWWLSQGLYKGYHPNNIWDWDKRARETNPNITNNNDSHYLVMLGYNYGQPIPDLSEYDKVIMCDVSFPKEEMAKLIARLLNGFIWIDHHISAVNDNKELVDNDECGIRDTKYAACELTWKYFFPNEPMPEIVRLLGRYDSFMHKGTDEEQKVLEFQYGARSCISNYEEAYYKLQQNLASSSIIKALLQTGEAIYQYLCIEAKQTYKNGFEITLEESMMLPDYRTYKRKFICINKERFNPINFGIDYHSEGYDGCACFWYNGVTNKWHFSLYNDNGEVDCSVIAKQFGGGGHKGAAGFVLNHEEFINLIK